MYLNCHSFHSLRYGTIPLNELVEQAKSLALKSLALTDINTITGIYDFTKQCKEAELKPIVGVEFRQNNQLLFIGLAKNQNGISFILVDMTTPGISVRALPTLDGPVEGQQEINQVFYEDVFVPAENLIGEEGKGWTYAKYLLEFERGNAYAPGLKNALKKVKRIAAVELAGDRVLLEDPDFGRKIAELEIQINALDATEMKIFSGLSSGKSVGAASSMLKCKGSEMQQAISELALEAVGASGIPFVADSWGILDGRSNDPFPVPDYAVAVAPSYFNYRKTSIYAGSNEIQRNIMAKMVLGL